MTNVKCYFSINISHLLSDFQKLHTKTINKTRTSRCKATYEQQYSHLSTLNSTETCHLKLLLTHEGSAYLPGDEVKLSVTLHTSGALRERSEE